MILIEIECLCGKVYKFACLNQRYLCRCGWHGTGHEIRNAARAERTRRVRAAVAKERVAIGLLRRAAVGIEGVGDTAERVALVAAGRGRRLYKLTKYLEAMLAECACNRVDAIAWLNEKWGPGRELMG